MLRRLLFALVVMGAATPGFAEPLRVVGNTQVHEIGPLALAAEMSPKGEIDLALGGVPNLWDVALAEMTRTVAAGAPGAAPPSLKLADLAANAETQLVRATVAHPDGRYLMTVVEGIYRVVARKSRGIATVSDLKGKRIGTYPGTSAAFYLHKVLQRFNLSEKDVTIVALSPKGTADALIAGTIDAMAMWEPDTERALRAVGADAIVFQPPKMYNEIYSLHTTEATLKDPVKRAQIVSYVRRLISACKQAATDPGHVQDLLSAMNGRPKADIAAAWYYKFPCAVTPNILDVMVEEERWLAAQDGRAARTRKQMARLIDTSIIKEASRPPKTR
jgi:NitT/TauT family transport system substrate-binding protein